ncbi:glycosyltransferase [Tepidamorphus sp. 3E244]|uniref:glycosyltransferase n=1 Tax=Tepidamorphus sp. 3E244 TaxID=3385498 RepID=UPI0038FBF961
MDGILRETAAVSLLARPTGKNPGTFSGVDLWLTNRDGRIAVVVPSFRVRKHILDVLSEMPAIVSRIYVVDDACPLETGKFVEEKCSDDRVRVIYHEKNQGVGGAVLTGYLTAIEEGMQVIVKIDGDGQMDPLLIPQFVNPILAGEADYTKGNRFFELERVSSMPRVRLFGNAMLSFMTKLSSGYWDIFDPANGYTAIHAKVAQQLPFLKISRRYFFETDLLFRINTLRAVVFDIPMTALYKDEESNLKVSHIVGEFMFKHLRNMFKRILYSYYLRDFSVASIQLPLGIAMFVFGVIFGTYKWIQSANADVPTPAGTVMLAAMPLIMGLQLLLAFLSHDVSAVPRRPIHKTLHGRA